MVVCMKNANSAFSWSKQRCFIKDVHTSVKIARQRLEFKSVGPLHKQQAGKLLVPCTNEDMNSPIFQSEHIHRSRGNTAKLERWSASVKNMLKWETRSVVGNSRAGLNGFQGCGSSTYTHILLPQENRSSRWSCSGCDTIPCTHSDHEAPWRLPRRVRKRYFVLLFS